MSKKGPTVTYRRPYQARKSAADAYTKEGVAVELKTAPRSRFPHTHHKPLDHKALKKGMAEILDKMHKQGITTDPRSHMDPELLKED